MGVKTALRTHLLTSSNLTAMVGTRVKHGWAAQGITYPYVTLHLVSNIGKRHLTGADPLAFVSFQVDVWAKKASQRETIAEAIRNVCDGYRGTVSGVDLRRVAVTNKGADSEEGPSDSRGKPIFRTRMEIDIVHREAVPTLS